MLVGLATQLKPPCAGAGAVADAEKAHPSSELMERFR